MNTQTTAISAPSNARLHSKFLGLLLVWLLAGCHSHLVKKASQTKINCPQLPPSEVTGWLDRIEGPCAVLYRTENDIILVNRIVLPAIAKEGDYIHRGQIDEKRTQQMKQQIHSLLNRPTAPRVVRLNKQNMDEVRTHLRARRTGRRRCKPRKKRRSRRSRLLPRRRWSQRSWRRRWQRWSYRSRCRRKRWRRWSKLRQKKRWYRLNSVKKHARHRSSRRTR